MNIFDQLRDIISEKDNKLAEDCELEKDFVPFLTQRWLSFYSGQFALILNNSANPLWRIMDEKQIWYKLFTAVLPKTKFKNIKYIKKNKEEKTTIKLDKDVVTYLAQSYELPEKNIREYLQSGVVDIKLLKKQLESN